MRVTSCTGKCSKGFLLLVNIIIFLVGGGLLGLGIYYHLEGGLYEYVFKEAEVITIPVIMMTLGSIFIVISFFAIVGALCEVVCMLKVYMGVVAIVLLLEVLLMAVCVAMRGDAEKQAIAVVHSLMEHYGNETADELDVITSTIDQTQIWLDCCGLTSPSDWNNITLSTYWTVTYNRDVNGSVTDQITLPASCCVDTSSTCVIQNDTSTFNTIGCKTKLYEFVDDNITYITVGGIVLIILQCFILICALKIRFELDKLYECEEFAGSHMEITSF